MKKLSLIIALFTLLVGCKSSGERYLPEIKGNPYEVLLVASDSVEKMAVYDTLRSILSSDVEMVNQLEPIYDIVTTKSKNFTNIMKEHRNVLFLDISPAYSEPEITVERDKYAKYQLFLNISAPTSSSMVDFLELHRGELVQLLDFTEQQRMVQKIEKRTVEALNDTISKMFNISIKIPTGYKLRNRIGDNFIWISYEAPLASQGLFIYSYPYDPAAKFSQQIMLDMRRQFSAMIPGPSKGSYMTTSPVVVPTMRKVVINKREWIEQRGFWRVENDFMGGPFVSFSALDKAENRVIVIDEYLYSPKNEKPQRNLIRQLENIVYTVSF